MTSHQTAEQLSDNDIVGHYINGRNFSDSTRLLDITNPATGEIIRNVAAANRNS